MRMLSPEIKSKMFCGFLWLLVDSLPHLLLLC